MNAENGGGAVRWVAPERLVEGERVGRFVVLRDLEGRLHALSATAVSAACETDEGTILMLPGARLVHVPHDVRTVLTWLERRYGSASMHHVPTQVLAPTPASTRQVMLTRKTVAA